MASRSEGPKPPSRRPVAPAHHERNEAAPPRAIPEPPRACSKAPEPDSTRALTPRTHERSNEREKREEAEDALLGEGRVGDERVTSEELASMGSRVAAHHLMVLLAKKRHERARESVLSEVGDLLIGLGRPHAVRRILLDMPDAGRIVDVYPLEVLAYVYARRPDLLPDIELGPIVTNKAELEAARHLAGEVILIKVPLSLKMRGFALEGGGTPGYCFQPGAPAEYRLELGAGGTFHLLVRGDVRKKILIDRVVLRVDDPPETP